MNDDAQLDTIGKRIKFIRGDKTQSCFAKELGIGNHTGISHYERDVYEPGSSFLAALARIKNVNLNWLVTGDGEKFIKNNNGKSDHDVNIMDLNDFSF